jgi:hypothetical protein
VVTEFLKLGDLLYGAALSVAGAWFFIKALHLMQKKIQTPAYEMTDSHAVLLKSSLKRFGADKHV